MFVDELPIDEAERLKAAYASLRPFDQRMANPGFRRMYDERNDRLQALLTKLPKPLAQCRILDFGCGSGRMTEWLYRRGASPDKLVGVEVQDDRFAQACGTYPHLNFIKTDGDLPFKAGSFDVILAFTVFSSILDPGVAQRVAVELQYALDEGGVIIWYDMRLPNPANRNLRAMTLARIEQLFRLKPELETLTLLPPLAERLGSWTGALYPVLSALPLLRSHYFGLLREYAETDVKDLQDQQW